MKRTTSILAAAVAATFAGYSAHANTVDGTVSTGEYSTVLGTQDTPTGFGDNLSELDQALSNYTPGGPLELALTGNLEANGNALVLFIDSKAGGAIANTVGGGFGQFGSVGGAQVDDWGTDTDGGANVSPTPGGGSILAPNFNPDYAIEINANGGGPNYYVNIIDLTQPNDDTHPNKDIYLGSNTIGGGGVTQTYTRDGGATIVGDITHAFNDSNTAGVTGADASGAATATTGFEFLFSKEFLARDPGHALRIMPFITNGGGDYLSNQFLPGLGGFANLGGAGGDGGTPLYDSRVFANGDQDYLDVFTPTTSATSGNWSAATFTGTDVPNGIEQAARITGSTSAALSMDLPGVTLGYLKFDNPAGITLNGPGILTFDGGSGAAAILASQGDHQVTTQAVMATDTRIDLANASSLKFDGSALTFMNHTLTKAGPGLLTINAPVNAADGALAVDSGPVSLTSDLGAGVPTPGDRPNLFAGIPGGPSVATVGLSSSQHLNTLAANANSTVTVQPGGDKVIVANNVQVEIPPASPPASPPAPPPGQIDLTNNKMIVTLTPLGTWNGTAYDGVTGLVASGRNGGAWNGGGIISSLASTGGSNLYTLGVAKVGDIKQIADGDTTTFAGEVVHGSDTVVMYTYGGDANLDGKINIDDYGRIDGNVGQSGSVFGWYNGDFNYDGKINIDDYGIIDGNIGLQGAPFPTAASGGAVAGVAAVPEPASMMILGLGALMGLRRRRSRCATA